MLRNNTLHQTSIKFIFLYYLIMCFYEEMCYNICCIFFRLLSIVGSFNSKYIVWQDVFDNNVEVCSYRPSRHTRMHAHTFNGPFSGTTRVSRYQKGKTNLDFTEARDSEWQWHQLGHMQVCTSRCPSCRPTNSVKALKACK